MRIVLVLVASALLGGCYAYPAYPVYGGGYAAVAPAPVVVERPYYRPYYYPYRYRYWR